jgi:hypothetical protein
MSQSKFEEVVTARLTVMEGRLKFLENQVQQQPATTAVCGRNPVMFSDNQTSAVMASTVSRQHLLGQYSSRNNSTNTFSVGAPESRAYSRNPWSPDIRSPGADDPHVMPHVDSGGEYGHPHLHQQLIPAGYQVGRCLSSPLRSSPISAEETAIESVDCSRSTCGTAASVAIKKLASRTKAAQALLSSLNTHA